MSYKQDVEHELVAIITVTIVIVACSIGGLLAIAAIIKMCVS